MASTERCEHVRVKPVHRCQLAVAVVGVAFLYKYTIARQLATKRVITNRGDEVGKLTDVLVNEATGEIENLLVEIDRDSKVLRHTRTKERTLEIPYSAVTAVSDVFIVDERELLTKA